MVARASVCLAAECIAPNGQTDTDSTNEGRVITTQTILDNINARYEALLNRCVQTSIMFSQPLPKTKRFIVPTIVQCITPSPVPTEWRLEPIYNGREKKRKPRKAA